MLLLSRGGRAALWRRNTGGREVREALMAFSSPSLPLLVVEVGGKVGVAKQLL